jgi:hypothetical protein
MLGLHHLLVNPAYVPLQWQAVSHSSRLVNGVSRRVGHVTRTRLLMALPLFSNHGVLWLYRATMGLVRLHRDALCGITERDRLVAGPGSRHQPRGEPRAGVWHPWISQLPSCSAGPLRPPPSPFPYPRVPCPAKSPKVPPPRYIDDLSIASGHSRQAEMTNRARRGSHPH